MVDPGLLAIGALAVSLAYLNGLHDASNAVSTTIATRALSERTALALAAALNLLGALVGAGLVGAGTAIAGEGLSALLAVPVPLADLRILLAAALAAALAWGILTWWLGMPSSTWHAMLGGLVGATATLGLPVPWTHELVVVAVSLLVSPLLGGVLTFVLVHLVSRLSRRLGIRTRHLRAAQTVSASAVAAGHGLHDVLLPMTVIAVAAGGVTAPGASAGASALPWWVGVVAAVAIATGTLAGGHRIIRTLATRLTDLSTPQGLAAETSTAIVLHLATIGVGAPVSTSHTVTAGIVASGLAVGPRSVRWPVVVRVALTWVATPAATAAIAAVLTTAISAAT